MQAYPAQVKSLERELELARLLSLSPPLSDSESSDSHGGNARRPGPARALGPRAQVTNFGTLTPIHGPDYKLFTTVTPKVKFPGTVPAAAPSAPALTCQEVESPS